MQVRLRKQWRVRMGRASTPSAAIIDAQPTRISPQGRASGFDAGKKVKGRKRHLVVDTMGLIIAVSVTAASVQDRDAAATVVTQACSMSPRLDKLYIDRAYGGKCAHAIEQAHHIRVAVVRNPGNGTTGTLHDAKTTLNSQPWKRSPIGNGNHLGVGAQGVNGYWIGCIFGICRDANLMLPVYMLGPSSVLQMNRVGVSSKSGTGDLLKYSNMERLTSPRACRPSL